MLRFLAAAVRLPSAGARRRLVHVGNRSGGGEEVESVSYRMSMLRAPPVERKKVLSRNSCSLIGRLDAPVRHCSNSSEEKPRAYTFLFVTPSSSSSSFNVTLNLRGHLANVCLKHLKQNDLIYVSGPLGCYNKVSGSGEQCTIYKIHVMELNYVFDKNKKPENDEDPADIASAPLANTPLLPEDKYRDRLRLWQVFFASPYEWWDNRKSKRYITGPDFTHKDTHEKLRLRPDDPPWVRKQLALHDNQLAENGPRDGRRRISLSHMWEARD